MAATPKDKKKEFFAALKSLDKQDVNTIASTGVGIGMGICGYYLSRMTALYGRTVTSPTTGLKAVLGGGFNPIKAIPPMGILNRVHDALDLLRTKNKPIIEQYRIALEQVRQAEEKFSNATDSLRVYLEASLMSLRANLDRYEQALKEFFELQQGLFWGQTILGAFLSMWLANNPEVVKQLITSTEKVAVRGIDEISEIIDKTGEGFKDAVEGLLPDVWGLGWG